MDSKTKRIERIVMILDFLPSEEDDEWERLSEWEQGFLPSVRRYFDRNGDITSSQEEYLEEIWKKLNR